MKRLVPARVPMLSLALVLLCASAGDATGDRRIALSPHEEEVARRIGFDGAVVTMIKKTSGEDHVQRMTGYNAEGYQIMADGIIVAVPHEKAENILFDLRARLRPLGYMAFIVEVNEGIKTDTIGVLKGADQYEILRVMQTSGEHDDVACDDVIAQLKEWEKQARFDIIGAENGWVELQFRKLPKDLRAFAEEVQDLAPDSVDEGARGIEDLAAEIKSTKRLLLWWE